MKISDILEHQNIQEGPLDTIGTAVGKTVGGVAKAAGAVAGGVAGIGTAVKKGYQAGKATVGGTSAPQATPAGGTTAGDSKLKKIGDKIIGKAAGGIKATGKGLDSFNKGLKGQDGDQKTPQDPFEIIKSLNKQQKQKLYNLL